MRRGRWQMVAGGGGVNRCLTPCYLTRSGARENKVANLESAVEGTVFKTNTGGSNTSSCFFPLPLALHLHAPPHPLALLPPPTTSAPMARSSGANATRKSPVTRPEARSRASRNMRQNKYEAYAHKSLPYMQLLLWSRRMVGEVAS